ncbi:hypothetical protein RhiirA1_504889 [Rhizophagus irregularis]|uniref:Ion transport domain-containing protein n=1 Tax=Rhizophagus irregularis TaxID=588596 RepID=A0A2N0SHZ9_9GLOM|nr:hypothetical protein RhiirA1_504889 [Rhizophagus irregularis]
MSFDKISIKVDDDHIDNDFKDEINEIDNENAIVNDNDVEPYIDKPIIEVSPNGTYLVIYNPEDHSIVGWNVEEIIDINHNQEIELNLGANDFIGSRHHIFNLKEYKIIRIFSTQTKNNKWYGERVYEIPEYFEFINISKYADKFYLFSNNSIYEWDLDTERGIKIFYDRELESHYIKRELKQLKHDVKISSNKMFICLRIMDKFIIYSIESAIPIVSLDLNNDTSLYKLVKYSELLLPSLPSLLPLLSSKTQNSIMEYCWKECLDRLGLKDEHLQTLPSNVQTTDKYAFGILDGNVWKIKLEENIPKINFSSQNSDVQVIEDISDQYDEFDVYITINLFKYYNKEIRELFQKVSSSKTEYERKVKLKDQNLVERIIITDKSLQAWKIKIIDNNKIMLRVFKKADVNSEWELTKPKTTEFKVGVIRNIKLLEIKLLTDDDIILITTIGFLIYHYNENKTISLIYWDYMKLTTPLVNVSGISEDFKNLKVLLKPYYDSQSNLPLPPNYNSFKINGEWISYVQGNKENLLRYGDKLLSFAIKEHELDLIEVIYNKCIDWFKEDLGNNWMFLNIISSAMPLLNRHYPEYVLRYSLETTMIIDHPFYSIDYQLMKSQLYSFQYLKLVNLTRSLLFLRYNAVLIRMSYNHKIIYKIVNIIQYTILFVIILLLPIFFIYMAVFYLLEKFHVISNMRTEEIFAWVYFVLSDKLSSTRKIPTITFMVPYINFVSYPQRYNWFLELFNPQSSPFVDTITNEDIYNTWSGEAIINFKWNTYGKYYYSIIWIGFLALLGCFTAAATIPQQYIDDDVRKNLLVASIIIGFIHLIFEVRQFIQFIYDPFKWILDFWNIFDFKTSLFATYKFLTGDSGALTNWSYLNNPPHVILIVLFSLLVVVYLMNLFIGLLNNEIQANNNRAAYFMQKAQVLAEIELFYLLPLQRRWKEWFPEVMHYYANVDDIQKVIREMKPNKWKSFKKAFPELGQKLSKKVHSEPEGEE